MNSSMTVLQKLYGGQLPFHVRLSNILFTLGVLVGLFGFLLTLIIRPSTAAVLTAALMVLLLAVVWILSGRLSEKNRNILITVTLIVANFALLPTLYLTGGSLNSGVSSYFVFGLALTLLLTQNWKHSYLLPTLIAASDLLVYAISYGVKQKLPWQVETTPDVRLPVYLSVGVKIVIVSLALSICGKLLFDLLRHENHKVTNAIAELSRRADLDSLTGLYNRRYLSSYLETQIPLAGSPSAPLSVILVDIDHFKEVNDRFGHIAGDDVLQRLARLLAKFPKGAEIVSRFGGEEFVFVLPGTSLEAAVELAERIRQTVEEAALTKGYGDSEPLTVSAGVAALESGMDIFDLVGLADRRMYRAKEQGRNRVCAGEERDRS